VGFGVLILEGQADQEEMHGKLTQNIVPHLRRLYSSAALL